MTDITANVVVSMPSQLFTMARSFKAVANGKIYIGKIDTDPVNPENQIQVYVENEDGSHVPVSQPIIINAAGYPVYNGQIAKFVTVQGHSMAVYDAYGAQQFYFPNVLKYDPDQLRKQVEHNLFNIWKELSNSYGINLIGTFESGFTIDDRRQAGLFLKDGNVYTRKGLDNVIVPPGSYPEPSLWEPVSFIKEETIYVGIEPFKLHESNDGAKNDEILERLARYIETRSGPVRVIFPKGDFYVGSQYLSGATGFGGSYIPNQKCTVRNFNYPLRYEFNDSNFIFSDGLRVGSFDPVTGLPIKTIQTNFDYRANRGILFGFNGCPIISISGRVNIDFNGKSVILGGEFGDSGYQCPEYGFWFIDHKVLIFDAHYTAYDGAMDAIYLAGLNGDDCYSRVTNFSINKMGRSAFVVAGGDNIYISGDAYNSGLGSISSSPGHNFAIESEVRKISNVVLEGVTANEAKFSSFSIYRTQSNPVNDIKVVNSYLSNSFNITCKSNTPNLKYIDCTFRGLIGEHRNEFFDHSVDLRAAKLIRCNHYDTKPDGSLTNASNGTHFDSSKIIRLTFSECNIISSGFKSGRGTIGSIYEAVIDGLTVTVNGDITFAATNGIKILNFENPVKIENFELINRTIGNGTDSQRAYIGVSGIENASIKNAAISGVGQEKDTILWLYPLINSGGRAGRLVDRYAKSSVGAQQFLSLGTDSYLNESQNVSGYQRIFSVTQLPKTGYWVRGDVLFFKNPSPGGHIGFVCTSSGEGEGAIFKAFGAISP
ncbi:phage head-binding domain-containing protein [Escherichia coli]|uniref:phage head-binding domain-containing protein n=1 Tax=Escherichia coli TaxID=562 RepID=UPI00223C4CA6|nr:phage head-binding domain-containing protein [Escherichia coli]